MVEEKSLKQIMCFNSVLHVQKMSWGRFGSLIEKYFKMDLKLMLRPKIKYL